MDLRIKLLHKMIHEGRDQCRNMLRRWERRNEYKINKSLLREKGLHRKWYDMLDLRDMKFTEMDENIDECFFELKDIMNGTSFNNQIESIDEELNVGEAYSGSDSDLSAGIIDGGLESHAGEASEDFCLPNEVKLPEYDPHFHASRIQNSRLNLRGSYKRTKKNTSQERGKRRRNNSPPQKKTGEGACSPASDYENVTLNVLSSGQNESNTPRHYLGLDLNGERNNNELNNALGDDTKTNNPSMHSKRRDTFRARSVSRNIDVCFSKLRRRSTKPIADRMQRFVDSNKVSHAVPSNINDFDDNDATIYREKRRLSTASNKSPAKSKSILLSGGNGLLASCSISQVYQVQLGHAYLFDVPRPLAFEEDCDVLTQPHSGDFQEIITDFVASYPDSIDKSISMMRLLRKRICLDYYDMASGEALVLFRGVTAILKKCPMLSILQMIHSDYQGLNFYTQLLFFIVELMSAKVQIKLKACQRSDDVIRSMYLNGGFIDFVVLQLIDLFYSQILKQPWGEAPTIPSHVCEIILSLVDSLGKVTSVMETVCRSLCTKFPYQQWYRISDPSNLASFLTSVNPSSLRAFVHKGESIPPTTEGKGNGQLF